MHVRIVIVNFLYFDQKPNIAIYIGDNICMQYLCIFYALPTDCIRTKRSEFIMLTTPLSCANFYCHFNALLTDAFYSLLSSSS